MEKSVLAALAVCAGLALGSVVVSGGFVMEEGSVCVTKSVPAGRTGTDLQLLENPGFETGLLQPWTTNNWIVDTIYPHGGDHCASDVGNYWIQQSIDTTPCTDIVEVSFWSRQPESTIQAYDFFYDDGSFDEEIVYPETSWTFHDVTATLNPAKRLVAIRIWGYSGGPPGPDSTYIDDVSIQTQAPDVGVVAAPWPPDTVEFDSTYLPRAIIHNYGPAQVSFPVAAVIDFICDEPYYWDTVDVTLGAGADTLVEFAPWDPGYPALHRIVYVTLLSGDENPANDTLSIFFYVRPGSGASEPGNRLQVGKSLVWPVPAGQELFAGWTEPAVLFDAGGRRVFELRPGSNDIRAVPEGVYFARLASGSVARVVVQR